MNTKKGFILAASIISIVAASLAILASLFLFFTASFCTEEMFVETMKEDKAYTYYETQDGYYFEELDEYGEIVVITDEEVASMATLTAGALNFFGFITLGMAIAKLVLAIRLVVLINKNKFSKGTAIALLVLCVLTTNILETVFLLVALCSKDKKPKQEQIDILNSDYIPYGE